jgi:hypothetical protein
MHIQSRRLAMRFGLGSLFLALTVASLLLAWGSSIVGERRHALVELKAEAGAFYVTSEALRQELDAFPSFPMELLPSGSVPWWREWLGDEAIETIYFPVERTPTSEEEERIARLFPEAQIIQQQYPPGNLMGGGPPDG